MTEPLLYAGEFDSWGIDLAGPDEDDPHAGCWQPHLGADGEHYDCDGQPL